MEFNYKAGQRLLIELNGDQIYEGDCKKCAEKRIDLINIIEHPSRKQIPLPLSFYKCEVLSVHVLDNVTDNGQPTAPSSSSPDDIPIQNETDQAGRVIAVRKTEYIRQLEMTRSYIYMDTIDKQYLEAVKYLRNGENVAVVGIDDTFGHKKPLSLLVLCSWNQVYIFDLFLFNKKTFEPELKRILESEDIKKIVHNSQKLIECLWHCHKVELKNVFDTKLAELILEKKLGGKKLKLNRNISETLEHCLNFPSMLLEGALEVTISEWEERPLLRSKKEKAAKLAAFLITLKDKQERLLLDDLYKGIQVFSQLTMNADQLSIIMSSMDVQTVPEELKEYL